ncbi:Translation initiation factor 3 subunit b [Coemansia sp. RSA 720]|nr:Translation initiation factor 3 subunit b [Coemansia sp. RSA 720]
MTLITAATKSGNLGDAISLLESAKHYNITELEWDPSGRYMVMSALAWHQLADMGYIVASCKISTEDFKQFLWHPRPQSLLSEEKKQKIRKDLKSYLRFFDEQDEHRLHAADAELLAAENDTALAAGYKLPIAADSEDFVVEEIVEEIIEEIIEEKEEFI